MKYAFTDKPVEGYEHRNPTYWAQCTPPKDATGVVVGDAYPEIAAHFKKNGVSVSVEDEAMAKPKTRREDVIESLEAHGVEKPTGSTKELEAQLKAVTEVNL